MYNTLLIGVNQTGFDSSDPLFVIGNGTGGLQVAKSDVLAVLKMGIQPSLEHKLLMFLFLLQHQEPLALTMFLKGIMSGFRNAIKAIRFQV